MCAQSAAVDGTETAVSQASNNIEDGITSCTPMSTNENTANHATSSSSRLPISTDSVLTPLEEFHLFPKLSLDLKFKVWDYMMPGPRLIEVIWNEERGLHTNCPLPVVLSASAESRTLALRKYKKLEKTNAKFTCGKGDDDLPYTYVDYSQDILYLTLRDVDGWYDRYHCPEMFEILRRGGGTDLQHVAVCIVDAINDRRPLDSSGTKASWDWARELAKFSNLKTISLVSNDDGIPFSRFDLSIQRSAVGFAAVDTAEDMSMTRWDWQTKDVEDSWMWVETFKEFLDENLPAFKDAMVQQGAERRAVENIEFKAIDIAREYNDPREQIWYTSF
ncbi:hypothetical protein BDZ45DRAFT_724857 [Acephala macrosclerotiorum]|nr:hypothetical protein BDZ45DRAFT_724857 [Acephala macrosclerotiorum]